jgi:hypothetical protein
VVPLPQADRHLSPFTGWTRDHWLATADDWLGQVRKYSSAEGAMTRLPGRVTGDGVRRECMETVARSFLLAAPRIAGAADSDPLADEHLDWYSRALLGGTRPGGAEEWPSGVTCRTPLAGVTNSIVEAANIAFGLHLTRKRLWDNLTRPEQRQLADWLLHHARAEVWQNNWQLFPAMAEGFLRSVGEDVSGTTGRRNVARVESWYLGDGWYTDGPEHSIDYYNAWAIHPYLWAWYRMTDSMDTPEGERHLERLAAFVRSYSHLFARDGSVLHIGRSLTYRAAVLAAAWCSEISGVNPLAAGATRRLASGVLSRFVQKGVGADGPLSLGWYEPFEPMCQDYSGFGSPYLAGIGFLGLALPEDAPAWTDVEREQPADGAPFQRAMPETGWLVSGQDDGVVRLINHGTDHVGIPVGANPDADDPYYAKFAYSTHTAPGTAQAWADDVDSHFALLDGDGNASRRSALRGSRVDGAIAGSVHLPQLYRRLFDGSAVTTVSFIDGPYEVRAHLLESPRGWRVREGGFAVAGAEPPVAEMSEPERSVPERSDPERSEPGRSEVAAWASGGDDVIAGIAGLHGWYDAAVLAYQGANAMGRHSATPVLFGDSAPGTSVFVSLHVLTRGALPHGWRSAAETNLDGTRLAVRWASGAAAECDLATFVPWDHHTGPKSANL